MENNNNIIQGQQNNLPETAGTFSAGSQTIALVGGVVLEPSNVTPQPQQESQNQVANTVTADSKKISILSVMLFVSIVMLLTSVYFKNIKESNAEVALANVAPAPEIAVVPVAVVSTSTVATTTEEIQKFDIVNNIKVPILATSTEMLKADTNNNGVRDDVERLIAVKSSTQESFDNATRTAMVIQKIINKKIFTKAEALVFMGEIKCSENKRTETEKKELSYSYLSKISADTSELQDIIFNLLTTVGSYKAEDLPSCSL